MEVEIGGPQHPWVMEAEVEVGGLQHPWVMVGEVGDPHDSWVRVGVVALEV